MAILAKKAVAKMQAIKAQKMGTLPNFTQESLKFKMLQKPLLEAAAPGPMDDPHSKLSNFPTTEIQGVKQIHICMLMNHTGCSQQEAIQAMKDSPNNFIEATTLLKSKKNKTM